jgi:pimeloyl-ACP methyl ester carboxylesterase
MHLFGHRQSQQPEAASGGSPSSESAAVAGTLETGEHELQLGAISLHFTTWGQPTSADRSAVLIHGLTASHLAFGKLGPALAEQGWYVIAPDLRGRGLSSKPSHGYSVSIHASDLLALSDSLGMDKIHVIGHSLGAVIGLYLAAVYPERVERLVLIDAGGKIPEDTAQAISASVSRLGMVYPSLDAYLDTMRQLPMIDWSSDWEAYFRYDAFAHPDGTVTSRVSKAAIEEESLALALARTEVLPELVRSPTLVVRAPVGLLGPDRGFILPREEADRLCRLIPASHLLEIEKTNHYTIMLADALTEGVIAFLATSGSQP